MLQVNNPTEKEIEEVHLYLMEHWTRYADGKKKSGEDKVISPISLGSVDPGTLDFVLERDLTIPNVRISRDRKDPHIRYGYYLMVKVGFRLLGISFDLCCF